MSALDRLQKVLAADEPTDPPAATSEVAATHASYPRLSEAEKARRRGLLGSKARTGFRLEHPPDAQPSPGGIERMDVDAIRRRGYAALGLPLPEDLS